MWGKRCSLCGGKLVNNVCSECGLDNSKNDEQYELNKSSCDGEPLTHVHSSPKESKSKIKYNKPSAATNQTAGKQTKMPFSGQTGGTRTPFSGKTGGIGSTFQGRTGGANPVSYTGQRGASAQRKTGRLPKIISKIISIIVILVVFGQIGGGLIRDIADNVLSSVEEVTGTKTYQGGTRDFADEEDYNYTSLTRSLADSGDSYEDTLPQGFYVVGVHIPEGNYTLSLVSGEGSFQVTDDENSIFLIGQMATESEYEDDIVKAENVYLYEGALVEVAGNAEIAFDTENAVFPEGFTSEPDAEASAAESREVSSESTVAVSAKEAEADSTQLPAGVYDLTLKEGFGEVRLFVPGYTRMLDGGEEYQTESVYLSLDSDYFAEQCKNVVIPEGTRIEIDGDMKVEFTPSEKAAAEDTMQYYETYYSNSY